MSLDPNSLDPNRIAGGIKAAFVALGSPPGSPVLDTFARALAKAIVDEFKNNAELVVTMPPDGTGTIK